MYNTSANGYSSICHEDMEFLVKHVNKTTIERLELLSSAPFECISYTKAVEILIATCKKFENNVEWGIDFASEHESYGDYNWYCYFCIS